MGWMPGCSWAAWHTSTWRGSSRHWEFSLSKARGSSPATTAFVPLKPAFTLAHRFAEPCLALGLAGTRDRTQASGRALLQQYQHEFSGCHCTATVSSDLRSESSSPERLIFP